MRPTAAPQFICDEMLGKLARSLRLLGFDVLYPKGAKDDGEVARLAAATGRILLTRDVALSTYAPRAYLLRTKDSEEQLAEVLAAFALTPDPERAFTRCSLCNTLLQDTDAAAAREKVPPDVAARHNEFMECATCGRVYWEGTHVARMRKDLRITGDAPGP
ncbi:MAG TPA: Mut7-C RNAse domain-containing protein [Candidatus Thermoplasmatota archaeon]|nr:Mut7-C RNAse domain-containing protein [Candidatus Thermoplasmatota archaeon]